MKHMVLLYLLALLVSVACAQTANLTNCEWFTGPDPGVGMGNPIAFGAPNDTANLVFTIGTGSLQPGITRISVRCRADSIRSSSSGAWTPAMPAFFFVLSPPSAGVARLVTQYEYRVDNGAWISTDVADAAEVNIARSVSTTGLNLGLHRIEFRVNDDLSRYGAATSGYCFIIDSLTPAHLRLVTQIQYWFDTNPPTILDVADASAVNFNEIIATAGLPVGLHRLNVQMTDDLGRVCPVNTATVLVISSIGQGQAHRIAAAEYWVNVDPGPGNGVAIPLPMDGTWNSPEESATAVITNLPIGLHLVGVRTRDEVGRWCLSLTDSIMVGPLLVVRSSGNDIVLDWQTGAPADKFKIYRAPLVTGPYALVDSTAAQSYTDVGATNTALRQFYQVTFQTTTLSSFRMPEAKPAQQ